MSSFFRTLISRTRRQANNSTHRRNPLRRFLRAQSLEDRTVPATFTVLNTNDGAVAAAGDLPGSLRQAIFDANALPGADSIVFDGSLGGQTLLIGFGEFLVTESVTITGPALLPGNVPNFTIDALLGSRHFNLDTPGSTGSFSISRLNLLQGSGANYGGSISLRTPDDSVNLTDMVLSGNTSANFGGAFGAATISATPQPTYGTVNITRCSFTNNVNSFNFGGAVSLDASTAPTPTSGWKLNVVDSNFDNNDSQGNGGAIFLRITGGGTLNASGTTFSNNRASGTGFGGGVSLLTAPGGVTNFTNCTFSGNSATAAGGGRGAALSIGGGHSGDVNFFNCTLTGNVNLNGGAIAQTSGSSNIKLESTITYGNIVTTSGIAPDFSGGKIIAKNSIIQDSTGGGTFTNNGGNIIGVAGDPLLQPLANNGGLWPTHLPGPFSPAREAGINPLGLSFDARGAGFPRTLGAKTDIGAIESLDPNPLAQSTLTNVTAPGATYQFTVTYSDDKAINTSTVIGKNDVIQVTGPNAFSQFATYVSIDNAANGTPRTVTYQITAPINGAAGFDKTDNGIYTVAIIGSKVFDNDTPTPLPINAGNLGTFAVGVPSNLVVTNDAASGAGSLAQAVADANSLVGALDSITFDPTFFSIPRTIKLAGELTISDSVLIIGPANAGLVTISGETVSRVFTLDGPGSMTVNMSGITIANGNAADNGGAINNTDESLVLSNCVLSNNVATTNGGAIWLNVAAASLTATNTRFTGNSSANGGAIARNSNGAVTIDGSTFTGNNTGGSGGAISMQLGALTVENSTFVGNSASGSGGAVSSIDGMAKVFYRNSTFSGNTAGVAGGAISTTHYGSSLEIFNSTIANNDAPAGSGVSHTGAPGGSVIGGLNIVSSIIANNTSGNFEVNTTGFDSTYSNSILGSLGGGAKIIDGGSNLPLGTNPLLAPLGNYGGATQTQGLFPGSPAVDAGSNPGGLSFDQRGTGFPRVLGSAADIGAFEGTLPVPGGALTPLGPITVVGSTPNSVTVTYTDNTGINVSSLGIADIEILDPSSNKLTITGFSVDNNTNGTPRVVTYTFAVPGGSWTSSKNGTYSVNLVAGQITDTDTPTPNTNVGYTMGTFKVSVPVVYVVDVVNDVDNGNTTAGDLSIREAVNLANADLNPSIITFSPAVFATAKTIFLTTGELGITEAVTITGPTAKLTIDGSLASRAFNVSVAAPNTVIGISNLTMTNCVTTVAGDDGGALFMNDEDVTLTNVTITNCKTTEGDGGAISISGVGKLTLVSSTISNNTAGGVTSGTVGAGTEGGGINADTTATIELRDSTLSGNTGQADGGGIYFYNGGGLKVTGSTISGNVGNATIAGVGGGGVYFAGTANATGIFVSNSTVSGNSAGFGAGNGYGGGIMLNSFAGNVVIQNSTFANNNAGNKGGGLAITNGASTITSSIFTNNSAGGVVASATGNFFSLNAHTVTGANNLVSISDAGNKMNFNGPTNPLIGSIASPIDAKLGALANNGGTTQTHAILAGSPAIDAGNNTAGLSFDQRGSARIQGGAADIGAFESAFSLATPAKVTSVSVNGGGVQRSTVTSVVVTFDNAPTFVGSPATAFTLERFVGGVGTGNTVTLGANVLGNTVTLTFSGALTEAVTKSLVDGVYQLRIDDAQLTNLDGDANGSIGGDYATATTSAGGGIFRLFGDADGSALVDTNDFLAFRLAFLSSSPTFDADGSGQVDTGDFLRFRLNFLKSV